MPKSIVIQGRRWFQKTNGNTYHSCTIIVDGVEIEGVSFCYGYDDAYVDSAAQQLEKAGILKREIRPGSGCVEHLWRCCERLGITLHYSAVDVARKKDL